MSSIVKVALFDKMRCSHCSSSSLMFFLNLSLNSRSFLVTSSSAAGRRHHRRRLLKHAPPPSPPTSNSIFKLSDDGLQITIKPPSSNSLHHLQTRLNQFVDYGREALDDLKTVVVTVNGGGLVISCRRSTVEFFLALAALSGLVIVVAFRSLFRFRKNGGEQVLVYKRDRSLGGKEVVVGTRETDFPSRISTSPLSLGGGAEDSYKNGGGNGVMSLRRRRRRRKQELPQWWPQLVVTSTGPDDKEEYQRIVDQIIRVIMDRKMNGQDISTNDIIQLHHICKTYGVRAFINTANARDSLYRTSINFVLSYCESISNLSTSVLINGEDAREFVAGFANSVGLESAHAARMVSAAVAARTRSRILQAWALEVQNRHSEALTELLKVCLIHRIFPPEESSPEMEMVARGLEKSLSVEQRESILNSFTTVCGKDADRSVMEALGLL